MTRPDASAAATPEDEPSPARGRLKIFFGYAAGVGRTRAMLRAAQRRQADGAKVVLVAEAATPALHLPDAERHIGLPVVQVDPLRGFDLDLALRTRPDLLLLPDLARQNPTGSRHRHRHRDVEELLAAGIDVWSTLEVAQLESLTDVVQQLTDTRIQNTVPGHFVDAAEIELIDLPPDELIAARARTANTPRVAQSIGVSSPTPADAAPFGHDRSQFETRTKERATLIALRELALRFAADRLSELAARDARSAARPSAGWSTSERLLVCVGPSPTSARVIRAADRMARSLHAPWLAVHIRNSHALAETEPPLVASHLQLAESLGAETAVIVGDDPPRDLVELARRRCVTKIVIGKTGADARFRFGATRSMVERVIANSGGIDVFVVRGEDQTAHRERPPRVADRMRLGAYLWSVAVLALGMGVASVFDAIGLGEAELVLVFLLSVAAVAAWLGRGPAIFASCLAVVLFNFFFTSPRHTLAVHDSGDIFTFVVMLVIGVLLSTLTARVRDQSLAARQRELRTDRLFELSRALSATTGHLQIVAAAESLLRALLASQVMILLPEPHGRLRPAGRSTLGLEFDDALRTLAEWVHVHGRSAGAGTDTHPDAHALCVPLATGAGVIGVLAIRTDAPTLPLLPDRRNLIETAAAQVALSLQRDGLAERMHRTLAEVETERLRSALLSSVSHDFRTPLSAIHGASSSLLAADSRLEPTARTELLRTIHDEAQRLSRLVDNLLHMTRLESGQWRVQREWNIVEDLVGSALTRFAPHLAGRDLTTDIDADAPLLCVDGVLIELVLVNLLDNATRYSPAGSPIDIAAHVVGDRLRITVGDRGQGVPADEKQRVFEKFFRGSAGRRSGSAGTGLGLAICSAIVVLHGGRVLVLDRVGGGAEFAVELPIEPQPPAIDDDVAAHEPKEMPR